MERRINVPFKSGGGSFLDARCPFCEKTTTYRYAFLMSKCSHYFGDTLADDKATLIAIFKVET